MTAETRPIQAIIVGQRHRQALVGIPALAANIREVGLLHPIVITPANELVAGQRRLEACRSLGWEEVPVTVVDIEDVIKGEWSENAMRVDFTPSEAVAIGRLIEEREAEKAKARRAERLIQFAPSVSEISPNGARGKTADIVGQAIGMSGTTYQRAKAVVEAAADDPEAFGPIAEEMDRTGKVSPAYDKVMTKKTARLDRTREGIEARRRKIEEMGMQGHQVAAIARTVGVDEKTVTEALARKGIQTVTQRIGRMGPRIDIDGVMERVIIGVTIPEPTMDTLTEHWDLLDRTRMPDWEESLSAAIAALSRLRRQMHRSLNDGE